MLDPDASVLHLDFEEVRIVVRLAQYVREQGVRDRKLVRGLDQLA